MKINMFQGGGDKNSQGNSRGLSNINLSDFESFCDTQLRRPQENQQNMSDDEDQRQERHSSAQFAGIPINHASEATESNRATAPNIDVNALIMSMNNLMQQNAMIMQLLVKNTTSTAPAPVQSYTVMPDFSKTIPIFNGTDLLQSKSWIEGIESAAMLHNWPPEFKLQTAKINLSGAAASWYDARRKNLTSWDNFKSAFMKTFVHEKNVTFLWKAMTSRTQGQKEDLSLYFHDKVKLCKELRLTFEEQKEQIAIGLLSRELATMIITKSHMDIDELYRDLLSYDRISNERRRKYGNEDRRENIRATNTVNQFQTTQTTHNQVQNPRYYTGSQGVIVKSAMKCFNCQEEGHFATNCSKPKRERGSCFICGSLQHQQRSCPQQFNNLKTNIGKSTGNDASTNLVEVPIDVVPSYRVDAQVSIGGQQVRLSPILDSGSAISLIREHVVQGVNYQRTDKLYNNFLGINKSRLNILGTLEVNLIILNISTVNLTLFVVPNNAIPYECLLGRDFITKSNLKISFVRNTLQIEKDKNTNDLDNDNFEMQIFNINVGDPEDEKLPQLNIEISLPNSIVAGIKELFKHYYLNAYRPLRPKIDFKMTLNLMKHDIFSTRPRRLSFTEKNALDEILKDLLERQIIRESDSPYCSAIVLTKKRNGDYRLCVDFRTLNKYLISDKFPIALIDDHLDTLRDRSYFTKLDLKNAFHHVELDEESRKYTSFVTPSGQFEYCRMPFALSSSPSTFARYISKIFKSLIESKDLLIYFDDILIATETADKNLEILEKVLTIMKENHLELCHDKCFFLKREIDYLGYHISENGIQPNDENVEVLKNYPVPSNSKEVQRFLGLSSYFRRFIQNFSLIAKPLYDLLKKNAKFEFTQTHLESFEVLKNKLTSKPILAIYSPINETELHCDASAIGFGSVLLQKQADNKFHPVFFFSKRTTECESKYHSYELECLAIVHTLKRFHIYLQGIHFKIVTDCDSFRLTLAKKDIIPRIMRWCLTLQNYDFDIEHRSSMRMQHVDALSRIPYVLVLEGNTFERTLALRQTTDPAIIEIQNYLENSEHPLFELRNGLVYRKQNKKLVFYVPKDMEFMVMHAYHNEMGHLGIDKTFELINRTYWYPEIKQKIKKHISNCLKCIEYNPISGKKEGFLHPIPKGKIPFETIHIDHYGPLEKTRYKNVHVFEVIDGFTKYTKFYSCKSTKTVEVIKHLKNYFNNYSKPRIIISDRGTCFTSQDFGNFMIENDIKHILIATGAPKANGQIERVNRLLTPILSKMVNEKDEDWDRILNHVEFCINNSVNRSTGETPARLLFGRNQNGHIDDSVRDILENLNVSERDLEEFRNRAFNNNIKVQEENKKYFDQKRKEPHVYKVGQYVMVANVDTTPGVNKKLIPKYRGPYVVEKILPNDRYVLTDIIGFQNTQIPYNGVVEVSRLKPYPNGDVDSA